MHRERPLDPDPLGDLPDGERLADPTPLAGDDETLEHLDPFLLSLANLHVDLDRVPRDEDRNVPPKPVPFGQTQLVHDHGTSKIVLPKSGKRGHVWKRPRREPVSYSNFRPLSADRQAGPGSPGPHPLARAQPLGQAGAGGSRGAAAGGARAGSARGARRRAPPGPRVPGTLAGG